MTTSEGSFELLSPAEIFQKITGGPGTSDLVFAEAQANTEWSAEEGRAELIKNLADTISSGWEGGASANAYGAAMPLRERTLQNAAYLERAQDLLSRQVGSFERAYNSVRPVPEVPRQRLDEPFPFDVDIAKEVALYQGVAQHNIDVFGQYDGASAYNETNMPQEFHAGGRDGGDVSVRSADTIEVGEPPAGSGPEGGPRGEDAFRPGGDGARPGGASDGAWSGGDADGARPGADGARPDVDGTRPGGVAGNPGADGAGRGVTEASGVLSPHGGQALANDRSVGGYPSAGYSSLAGGSVSGGAGPGVGGYSGGAPRMGGQAVVRGPGSAVGVGGLAAEESAVRRGVVSAGPRPGSGPIGAPVGAGRGKDDEDSEHERKVLIEVDAEEMFGSEVLTAPSVIGDDEFED